MSKKTGRMTFEWRGLFSFAAPYVVVFKDNLYVYARRNVILIYNFRLLYPFKKLQEFNVSDDIQKFVMVN